MKPETQYKLLVKVASADRAAGILARIAGAQQVKTAGQRKMAININEANARLAAKRAAAPAEEPVEAAPLTAKDHAKALWSAGKGQAAALAKNPLVWGGLGGAALGAGAGYALSGLSPAMKKKKLYRILAALGGGAAGAAAGVAGTKYIPRAISDFKKSRVNKDIYDTTREGAINSIKARLTDAWNRGDATALAQAASDYSAYGNPFSFDPTYYTEGE